MPKLHIPGKAYRWTSYFLMAAMFVWMGWLYVEAFQEEGWDIFWDWTFEWRFFVDHFWSWLAMFLTLTAAMYLDLVGKDKIRLERRINSEDPSKAL